MSVKIKQIKAVARKFELLAVDFVMIDGRLSSEYSDNKRHLFVKVKMSFSNGDEFVVTKREYESFGDFKFKLAEKHKTNH